MNQQVDSRKKNLWDAAMKPRNCQQGWFLSHMCEHRHNRKRNRLNALQRGLIDLVRAFCALAFEFYALALEPFALDPSERLRHRLLQRRDVLREQKECERQHPESEHREEAEKAADNQEKRERNTDVDRCRLAYPANELRRPRRQLFLKPGKMPVELLLMCAQRTLSSCPKEMFIANAANKASVCCAKEP